MLKDRPMELGPKGVDIVVSGQCPLERSSIVVETLDNQINGRNSAS